MSENARFFSEITTAPFTITADDGEKLHCDARYAPDAGGELPVIVVVHGFKGFKDWGSFPYVCEELARHGFYVISFNFSHNGVEGSSQEFTRLDLFERNTFTREVRETRTVIAAVSGGAIPEPGHAARSGVTLLGHSRGGGIAILAAADDPRVSYVVTWAAVASFDRYTDAQKRRWREQGVLESKNMRTGQMMRLGVELLDDVEHNAAALDIGAAAERLGRPLLIVHGEQDLSVLIDNGDELARRAAPDRTQFIRVPRTNHTFGAVHPFDGPTPALTEAIASTVEFLEEARRSHRTSTS